MAMSREDRLLKLFNQLEEQDKNSTIDFMEYLASRQTKQLQDFYENLPEVDEPFSEEELQQMKDTEFVTWEEACEDLGWNDEHPPKQKSN